MKQEYIHTYKDVACSSGYILHTTGIFEHLRKEKKLLNEKIYNYIQRVPRVNRPVVKLTTHLHPEPWSKTVELYFHSPYVFMA
jgi:hypothetical protein